MQCAYCPQGIHTRNYTKRSDHTVMTYEDFVFMLAKVTREVEIVFAGMAEPFLNQSALNMVEHALGQKYDVGIYTTGAGLTDWQARKLIGYDLSFLALHLPDAGGVMHLNIDYHYLTVIRYLIHHPKVSKMVVGKLHPEVEQITGPATDHTSSLLSRAGNLKPLQIAKKSGVLECSACGPKIDHNILLPNGDVLLCCMDYGQEHIIGNLWDMEYEEIFESKEYKRVMNGLKEDSDIICRKCELSKYNEAKI